MKKVRILILSIICIVILAGIAILIINENYNMDKTKLQKQAQEEQAQEGQTLEAINLKIDIKQETDESYKCLLTFTANSESDKIKSIEYPAEEGKELQIINVEDENGTEKIGIDYEIKKNDEDKIFKVETTKGNSFDKRTGYSVTYMNGDEIFKKDTKLRTKTLPITNLSPTKEGKQFIGYSKDKNEIVADYFENGNYSEIDKDGILYAIYTDTQSGKTEDLNNDSLIGKVSKINTSGVQNIEVNGVTYSANVIVENNDLVLDGEKQVTGSTLKNRVYEFGNSSQDVATASGYAKNMIILKVNGNLTINSNVTLTACKSENGYGGPKGLFIYCTGTLSNNGIIDMTAKGAWAEGQDVYLWQNADKTYEYVPNAGATGGTGVRGKGNGKKGSNGIDRQTGGGGSGGVYNYMETAYTQNGSIGTSYSGGTGSGGTCRGFSLDPYGKAGSSIRRGRRKCRKRFWKWSWKSSGTCLGE